MQRTNESPRISERELKGLIESGRAPATPRVLRQFLRALLDVEIADHPLLEGSSAPMAYLTHSFFEGTIADDDPGIGAPRMARTSAPADCVVWAARGSGKTFLGAVATMLDLVFKPGIEVRVLGGSLEQSQRMHEHLQRLFERPTLNAMVDGQVKARGVTLRNGSRARILAQSQTSVRGTRVQKLRCDEVELFDREVWEAAQLTTRSMQLPGPWGPVVRGAVEALSTMHQPFGLMWDLVSGSTEEGTGAVKRRVFRWGVLDVLARCADEHTCASCVLAPECAGRAKARDRDTSKRPGHLPVADACRMKERVPIQVWESEMLCLRPRRVDCVLPEFDPSIHVGDWDAPKVDQAKDAGLATPAWVAGMDFGFRAPTVVLLAWSQDAADSESPIYVEAEHVATEWTLDKHIGVVVGGGTRGWPAPAPRVRWIGVDPAGHQRSDQTGLSAVTALKKAGMSVRSRRLSVAEGIELTRARLKGPRGPRLFIHKRCERLIECLQRYHYPTDRPESTEPDKRDGFDHAVDALRYLVVNLDRPHTCVRTEY